MRTSGKRRGRPNALVTVGLGLLLVGAAATPARADTIRSKQWYLDAMGAEKIWSISTGEGVTVAVVDSGVDAANPDLLGRVLPGKDLAPGESGDERTDPDGHGTGMAGLIAGTGESGGGDGAFGLAPGAKIFPVRVPTSDEAKNEADSWAQFNEYTPRAIRAAADANIKIINISMGAANGSERMTDAVKYALGKGALIFAATGNKGETGNKVDYPARTPGVVGVGGLAKNLQRTPSSTSGPEVDLSAPGDDMVHACGGKTALCRTSGTSDATALASATAALIWSVHPDWTNNQVLRVMLNTVGAPTDGAERNNSIGYGAVRPLRALKSPGDPGPADEYPLPDLAAAASPPPATPRSSATTGEEPNAPATDKPEPAAAPAGDGGSSTGLWIGLGLAAAAVLAAAVAVPLVRSRRRKAAVGSPPPSAYVPQPHPYQQPGPYHHAPSQPQPYSPPQPQHHPPYGPPPSGPPGAGGQG